MDLVPLLHLAFYGSWNTRSAGSSWSSGVLGGDGCSFGIDAASYIDIRFQLLSAYN